MNTIKPSISLLLFGAIAILIAGCNEDEANLQDGDHHITEEIDKIISDYIIEKYSSLYFDTDKQFEVHKVFGTSNIEGVLSVYMWSYYGGFNKSTGLESQSGHSLPVAIRLSRTEEEYTVIDYKEPKDGSLYQSSLRKMFPEKYVKLANQGSEHIDDLQNEMEIKVNNWLEKQD
ncbi:hypothetical protein SAMN05216389_102172 [Oceanobacillus limi]|uniref:DUF4825 domain-containing protein n=1 Tax=Oceanobacillus limi TaxID=930131 RepID=A0A1H9ZAU2_9BACI|nr:hypothetical protein [Oceanobacillus limi]SES78656.1 hypothetical protein SAMN05216389_102172 [Oceanobacillus limi]